MNFMFIVSGNVTAIDYAPVCAASISGRQKLRSLQVEDWENL